MQFSKLFFKARKLLFEWQLETYNTGQSGTTLVEAGDRNPGALFSQNTEEHAETPVPCFRDSDILHGEKGPPLKQVLWVGKVSHGELKLGRRWVLIDLYIAEELFAGKGDVSVLWLWAAVWVQKAQEGHELMKREKTFFDISWFLLRIWK